MFPMPTLRLFSSDQRRFTFVALVFSAVILATGVMYVVHRDAVYWEYRSYIQQNEESNRLTTVTRSEAQQRIDAFDRSISNNVAFRPQFTLLHDQTVAWIGEPKAQDVPETAVAASTEPTNEFLDTGAAGGATSTETAEIPASTLEANAFDTFVALQKSAKATGAVVLCLQAPGKCAAVSEFGEGGMDDYYSGDMGDDYSSGSGSGMAEMRVESLLQSITGQGVPVLDLRSVLAEEGRNPAGVFPDVNSWSPDTIQWVLNALQKTLEANGANGKLDMATALEAAKTLTASVPSEVLDDSEAAKQPSSLTNPNAPNDVRVLIIGDATRLLLANSVLAGCKEVQTCDFGDVQNIQQALETKPDVVLEITNVDTWK